MGQLTEDEKGKTMAILVLLPSKQLDRRTKIKLK